MWWVGEPDAGKWQAAEGWKWRIKFRSQPDGVKRRVLVVHTPKEMAERRLGLLDWVRVPTSRDADGVLTWCPPPRDPQEFAKIGASD